jgi:hypothetical protein
LSATEAFRELLKKHQEIDLVRYDVEHNHAPMVLIALYRMGADPERLRHYYASMRIDPRAVESDLQQAPPIVASRWMERLGDFQACGSYCRFFTAEIERRGVEEVLRCYVGPLMTGVAAHAFHPLLRLGYGIDLMDSGEMALALGYWAATYLPAPDMPLDSASTGPIELLNTLANTASLRAMRSKSSSIAERIREFYSQEDFRSQLRPIRFDAERPLREISLAIAEAFVQNHHFTMLHGVTGCHALRMVLPYCDDLQKVISDYWYAVCAAYLSVVNLPADMHRALPESATGWSPIQEQALATGIEHTIKLTYSCLKEAEEYDRDVYRRLALREVAVAAPFF